MKVTNVVSRFGKSLTDRQKADFIFLLDICGQNKSLGAFEAVAKMVDFEELKENNDSTNQLIEEGKIILFPTKK